jgi:hypothetical protein
MVSDTLPLHHSSQADVAADPATLFAHLDDHRRLSAHMEKPSLMTAGASMRIEVDPQQGRSVGSQIRLSGRVLGLELQVQEVVVEHDSPRRKVWETRGTPRLLVIDAYRMGFSIEPRGATSRLTVFIDYSLPQRGLGRALGRWFGAMYARWCTQRMVADAVRAFPRP